MLDPARRDPARLAPARRRELALSPAAFEAMAARIEASLALSADGEARVVAARPGDDARFMASAETFSILHLCNHWTAELLNAAGIAVRPARTIASGEVMRAATTGGQASVQAAASPDPRDRFNPRR